MTPTKKISIGALLILLLPAFAAAQSGTIAPSPFLTILDNAGHIVSGGCIWTYTAGTTTPAITYSAKTISVPNQNADPIIADSAGRFTAYLVPGNSYKFVYENIPCSGSSHGSVLRTADNIDAVPLSAANVDITGTVGETITAGQVVYLSDGSGSKTQGQWYKADSSNAYSSATPQIGVAPSAITSGASGTIRIAGSVTGLSALSVGGNYYVSTAGGISTTAPSANARFVGQADTATSLVVTPDPPFLAATLPINPAITDGRLTLTTGTPVTTADVTTATTLYFAPYTGNRIALYDGTSVWASVTFSQLSIAVPNTASTMYDVFVYNNSGTATLELLAWTSDTARATALTTQDGVLVKTGALTRKYVGSFRTTGVSGQTEDSFAKRYVWNYYNRVIRPLRVVDTTNSWDVTSATFQQANASAANQIDVVVGWAEVALAVRVVGVFSNSGGASNQWGVVAIGEDGITRHANCVNGMATTWTNSNAAPQGEGVASLDIFPAVGRHYYTWLESNATGAGTGRFFGDNGASLFQTGIFGTIQG